MLSNSQAGPGRKFSQPRDHFLAHLCTLPGSERSHLEGGAEAGDLQLAPEFALVAAHAVHHAGDVAELLLENNMYVRFPIRAAWSKLNQVKIIFIF